MKLTPINLQLAVALLLSALCIVSFNGSGCMRTPPAWAALLSFVPSESEGLLVIDMPATLKAPVVRSFLIRFQEKFGFDPVLLLDFFMQEELGMARKQIQQLALFWLPGDSTAGNATQSQTPHTDSQSPAPKVEEAAGDTGLLIRIRDLNADKILKKLLHLPGIKEVSLPEEAGRSGPPSLSYYYDESFNISFFLHGEYLFLASSAACIQKLLVNSRAPARPARHREQVLTGQERNINLFSVPEFWPVLSGKQVKILIKPDALNLFLRAVQEQPAEQDLSESTNTYTSAEPGAAAFFTPLPAAREEAVAMLGAGISLDDNVGLEVCLLYEAGAKNISMISKVPSGQKLLNQAVLLNSLGWDNYQVLQKVMSEPRYSFKQKSIQIQGVIRKEFIPAVTRYLLDGLVMFFPYDYYLKDSVGEEQMETSN